MSSESPATWGWGWGGSGGFSRPAACSISPSTSSSMPSLKDSYEFPFGYSDPLICVPYIILENHDPYGIGVQTTTALEKSQIRPSGSSGQDLQVYFWLFEMCFPRAQVSIIWLNVKDIRPDLKLSHPNEGHVEGSFLLGLR